MEPGASRKRRGTSGFEGAGGPSSRVNAARLCRRGCSGSLRQCSWPSKRSWRASSGGVKALALAFQEREHRAQGALLQKSKSIATEVAPTSEGGRCAGAAGFCLCSWLPLPRFAGERAGERGRSSLPCAAVSRGRSGREAGIDMDVDAFSLGQDARSKSPAPAHELAGRKPGKRQAGWPSLWLLSLGHPRESSSRSVRSAKALLWLFKSKSIAAEAAPT